MTKELEKRKEKSSERFDKWIKNPYVIALILITILGAILRIYIFSIASGQGLWWDEAEYMAKAKDIAFGHDWKDIWNPHKPILLTLISVPIFFLGFGEIGVRILILLFSIASIPLIYFPVKEFFEDKKIGLIASFLLAIYWVHLFFTGRLLIELPSALFFFGFWYFFYKGFIKKENPKYLWLAAIFFGIAFMFRAVYGVVAIPVLIYMVLEDKLAFFKNKNTWIALLLLLLTISPLIIWLFVQYPSDPFGEFLGLKHSRFSESAGAMGWDGVPLYLKDLPFYGLGGQYSTGQWIFFALLLFGALVYFSDLIFGWDLIFKGSSKKLRIKLFILLFIVYLLITWGNTRAYVEQRDYLSMAVFLFGIIGVGLIKIKNIIAKQNKKLAILVILVILALGAYYNVSWGIELSKQKSVSAYDTLKEAGLWIKANSQPGDIIYSSARKQMTYYSERQVLDPSLFDYKVEKTPEQMAQELENNTKIKLIEMDIVEKRPVSEILYNWIQANPDLVEPVKAWYTGTQQNPTTVAVVYKFKDR